MFTCSIPSISYLMQDDKQRSLFLRRVSATTKNIHQCKPSQECMIVCLRCSSSCALGAQWLWWQRGAETVFHLSWNQGAWKIWWFHEKWNTFQFSWNLPQTHMTANIALCFLNLSQLQPTPHTSKFSLLLAWSKPRSHATNTSVFHISQNHDD